MYMLWKLQSACMVIQSMDAWSREGSGVALKTVTELSMLVIKLYEHKDVICKEVGVLCKM